MSDRQPQRNFEDTIHGEWSTIAAYLQDLLRQKGGSWIAHSVTTAPARCHLSTNMGAVNVIGEGDTAKIEVYPYADTRDDWRYIVSQAKRFASGARASNSTGNPTADEVIEGYYRSKAQGSRITLRQLAEKYGFNPSYLRSAKSEYDARGGWGSKKKRQDAPDTSTST